MEIKVKVWDKKQEKMSLPFTFGDLYGYEGEANAVTLSHPCTGAGQNGFEIASHSGGSMGYPQEESHEGVNPNLVFLLYTGSKDKNGGEVYGGDLIKPCSADRNQVIREVYWDDSYHGFRLSSRGGDKQIDKTMMLDFVKIGEIIGNIYENPELSAAK